LRGYQYCEEKKKKKRAGIKASPGGWSVSKSEGELCWGGREGEREGRRKTTL